MRKGSVNQFIDELETKIEQLKGVRSSTSVVSAVKKPRYWDTMFRTKVIDAYNKGELTTKNIEEWETKYNGGVRPNKPLGTREILDYYRHNIENVKSSGRVIDDGTEVIEAGVDYDTPVYSAYATIHTNDGGSIEVDVSVWDEGDEYAIDIGESFSAEINGKSVDTRWITKRMNISWSWSDEDLDYMKEQCAKAADKITKYFEDHPAEGSVTSSCDNGTEVIEAGCGTKKKKIKAAEDDSDTCYIKYTYSYEDEDGTRKEDTITLREGDDFDDYVDDYLDIVHQEAVESSCSIKASEDDYVYTICNECGYEGRVLEDEFDGCCPACHNDDGGYEIIEDESAFDDDDDWHSDFYREDVEDLAELAVNVHTNDDLETVLDSLSGLDAKMYEKYIELTDSGEYSPAALGKMISDELYWGTHNSVESSCGKKSITSAEELDEKVTIGIYGDEVDKIKAHSVSGIVSYLERKGFKVTDVEGDMDYGWEMNVTGYPKELFAAICNVFPGYNNDSVSEFIEAYRIDDEIESSCVTSAEELDEENVEISEPTDENPEYLTGLYQSVEQELNDLAEGFSWKVDEDNIYLDVNFTDGHIFTFTIPKADLAYDLENMDKDIQYICVAVREDFGQVADDVDESAVTLEEYDIPAYL